MSIKIKSTKVIEDIFTQELASKGYKVIPIIQAADTLNQQNFYLLDLFIYQYLSDYPAITLTIRKGNNIHYIENKRQMLFTDHQDAIQAIARRMAKEIPKNIQEELFYRPKIEEFIPEQAHHVYAAVSSSIAFEYAKKHQIDFTFSNEQELDFILVNQIKAYLGLCVNFEGFRKYVKEKVIVVNFSVDKKGLTKIEKVEFPEGIPEKYKKTITNLCEAFPIWSLNSNNKDCYTGTIKVGLKK